MRKSLNIGKSFFISDETRVVITWCPNQVEDHVHLIPLVFNWYAIVIENSLSIWREWKAELAWE